MTFKPSNGFLNGSLYPSLIPKRELFLLADAVVSSERLNIAYQIRLLVLSWINVREIKSFFDNDMTAWVDLAVEHQRSVIELLKEAEEFLRSYRDIVHPMDPNETEALLHNSCCGLDSMRDVFSDVWWIENEEAWKWKAFSERLEDALIYIRKQYHIREF